jgi:hypothetical protein
MVTKPFKSLPSAIQFTLSDQLQNDLKTCPDVARIVAHKPLPIAVEDIAKLFIELRAWRVFEFVKFCLSHFDLPPVARAGVGLGCDVARQSTHRPRPDKRCAPIAD